MNLVDNYFFDNSDVVIQLQNYTEEHLNNNAFLPSVDIANNQSFYSQLDTLVLQPFYTFIYLNNNSGNNTNLLYYLDEQLFGSQSSLTYDQKLRFYVRYRKELDSSTATIFNPDFFKNVWYGDKTSENQYVYLYLDNKNYTIAQAYNAFRSVNTSDFKTFTGTILASYDAFQAKWSELLLAGYNFSRTQHHPVFDGTHCWNQLPLSLRRRWRKGIIQSTDPFLILVNCCISPIFHSFFTVEQVGQTWPIYEAHALSANEFDARYFRVPGPTRTCFYFSLPAIWEQLNGYNELEGRWNVVQYCLSRMTQVLRLPIHFITEIPANLSTSITSTSVEENIRNVDRTQRFLCSYSQTLNNSEQNSSGLIDQSKLTELGYIYNNYQYYSSQYSGWLETNQTISDEIPRVLTTDNTDYRFTHYSRVCDTSILNSSYDFINTANATSDGLANLQSTFIIDDANITYNIFSVGMIDDPRNIQEQLYDTTIDNHKSVYNAMRYAEHYIVNLAETVSHIETYLFEYFNDAVPSTITISIASIGAVSSITRQAFYTSIEEYLLYFLKHKVISITGRVSNRLTYHPEIRKLNYLEKNELDQTETVNAVMLTGLTTYDPSNTMDYNTYQHINSRNTSHIGVNTSDNHSKLGIQTPFNYFQVSPQLAKTEYNYQETPVINRLQYDWNEVCLFPSSYDSNYGCLIDSEIARRYVNSGSSVNRSRRPITYGESVEITQNIISHTPNYWSVGEPIHTVGNYGYDYISNNQFIQTPTSGVDSILLESQDTVQSALFNPYSIVKVNQYTIPSVLEKHIYIPVLDLMSNHKDKLIPRVITGDTYLELAVYLNKFNKFFFEWSSARKLQATQLSEEYSNFYIRDQHIRNGLSEFELRDPFDVRNEISYIRLIADSITNEGDEQGYTDVSVFPSLNGDIRNYRENMYKMWCGYAINTDHPLINIPEVINTINDRVVLQKSLPWYSRYKTRPSLKRLNEPNQFNVALEVKPHFHYYGFTFTPEFNKKLIDTNSYMLRFRAIQLIDKVQLDKEEDSVKIETNKQVFDIRFNALHGTEITVQRGLEDIPKRLPYIIQNPIKFQSNRFEADFQLQRYLDGGGLWLGTDTIAIRYQQLGVDPTTLRDIEIPAEVTPALLSSIPQFDTNFTLSGEIQYPVLVEYPKIWNDLHGTIVQQERIAPFMNNVERPCVIWSTPTGQNIQRYSPYFFKSILFNVSGDEIGPQKDGRYYHDKFSFEHFHKITEPNLYGIQFGLGYWKEQPLGYFDFGASTNTNDRYFSFVASQVVNQLNTTIEKNISINFDLNWQNILFASDGLFYTRYIR